MRKQALRYRLRWVVWAWAWIPACLVISAATVYGEPTMYFDEAEYLGALTAQGDVTVYESFEEDDYWGLVRGPSNNRASTRCTPS